MRLYTSECRQNSEAHAASAQTGMSALGAVQPNYLPWQSSSTLRSRSSSASLHLRALSEGQRVFYVDAEIANGAFDFRMAEQDLYSAQVAGLFIDDGRLGSA
jgi:hypothetical protein